MRCARVDLEVRVVDDGADYEYRIVGDANVQAFGSNFQGARLTEVEAVNPTYGLATRAAFVRAVRAVSV